MTKDKSAGISRRNLLGLGLAGAGAMSLFPTSAFANGPIAGGTSARAVDEQALSAKFTDLHGVREEYRQALAVFPLRFPEGFQIPAESQLSEQGEPAQWERGIGKAEVYIRWQEAAAAAAFAAWSRKDSAGAIEWLDAIQAGYESIGCKVGVVNPSAPFADERISARTAAAVDPLSAARRGDFSLLRGFVAG